MTKLQVLSQKKNLAPNTLWYDPKDEKLALILSTHKTCYGYTLITYLIEGRVDRSTSLTFPNRFTPAIIAINTGDEVCYGPIQT